MSKHRGGHQKDMRGCRRRESVVSGFTLTEILVASLIASVVAWGTVSAFVAAARMSPPPGNAALAEAATLAQQLLDRKRNMIACGEGNAGEWFDAATCAPTAALPTTWTDDPLPAGAGTGSIVTMGGQRRYCVTPADCDGDGTGGDCFVVRVAVCWKGTPCPPIGGACP